MADAPTPYCSLFDHARDNRPEAGPASWLDLVDALRDACTRLAPSTHGTVPGAESDALKIQQPAHCPASFAGLRAKGGARWLTYLVVDIDHTTEPQLIAVLRRLDAYGLTYAVHTTWSHAPPSDCCYRVLIPFARPVAAAHWPQTWAWAVDFIGLHDKSCKDASRIYFMPPGGADLLTRVGAYLDPPNVADIAPTVRAPARTDPVTKDRLEALAIAWSRPSKNPERIEIGRALRRVTKGEDICPTNRDTMLMKLSRDICREMPDIDPESAAAQFEQSLDLVSETHRGKSSYEYAADHFVRALEHIHEERIERAQKEQAELKLALAALGRDAPYSREEIEAFENKPWIVQHENTFWIFDGRTYRRRSKSFRSSVLELLAPAPLVLRTDGGAIKPDHDLVHRYGAVADRVIADLGADQARFERTAEIGTMIEAPCPLRKVEPASYSPIVDAFIEKLCGEKADAVRDWMATIYDLSEAAPALAFDKAAGAGKSLFAAAMANCWNRDPTPLIKASQKHNGAILQCPLVFGDEFIPLTSRGEPDTEALREIIQRRSHPIEIKGAEVYTAKGAARIVIAANNLPPKLRGTVALTRDDIQAIGDRFLYVEAQNGCVQWLVDQLTKEPNFTKTVFDMMPGHVAWLRSQGRPLKRGTRFAVPSDCEPLVRSLDRASGARSHVIEWIWSWIEDPKGQRDNCVAIQIDCKKILVNAKGMHDLWDIWTKDNRPTMSNLKHAIDEMGGSTQRIQLSSIRRWFVEIPIERLAAEPGRDVDKLNGILRGK